MNLKCKICEKECKNFLAKCRHIKGEHELGILEYSIKYDGFEIPKCRCGKDKKLECGITFRKSCDDKECRSLLAKTHTHSDETRKMMSEKKKYYFKENPDKHPWKYLTKFKSVPCETLKNKFREHGFDFIEEFTPLNDRAFSIDIAFPDKMIGIEINGYQHYDGEGNLKPYYQERHDLIEKEGWTLLEYHYANCFKDEFFNDLKEFILNKSNKVLFDYKTYVKVKRSTPKYGSRKLFGEAQRKEWEEDQQKYIPLILNSNIDFSKFGWVTPTSLLLNVKPQLVNRWMKRIMPEFYETKCFKVKR